jgi:hypothetical protein
MIGAGTIINPILKIVTTVAILGAVYLFIVKPTLDTTEDITDRAFDSSSQIQQDIRSDIESAFDDAGRAGNIDVKIPKSAQDAQKMGDCVAAAGTDIDRINRCMERFAP